MFCVENRICLLLPKHPPPLTPGSCRVITFFTPPYPSEAGIAFRSHLADRVVWYSHLLAAGLVFLFQAMSAARVMVGLVPEVEVVVRGGYLKGPVVATGLKIVGGRIYMYLVKSSSMLCSFLTKETARTKPLAKTFMFERIAAARDAKYKELLLVEAGMQAPPAAEIAVATGLDLCDTLGMDNDTADVLNIDTTPKAAATGPTKKKQRISKKSRTIMTPAAQISLPREGQSDWKFWVLMEPASKAPAFEPSVENLQALFDLVDNEITYGTVHRAKHGAATGHLRPKPRGPKGAREYAVGNRWVKKMQLPKVELPSSAAATSLGQTSPSKPFKTMKRRRSDDNADPAPRRKATRPSVAQGGDALDSLGL